MFIEKAEEAKQMKIGNDFVFKPEFAGFIGVERECVLLRDGNVVPMAKELLDYLRAVGHPLSNWSSYELSACQFEDKTPPCATIADLRATLRKHDTWLKKVEKRLGFDRLYAGLAPANMPLDIYTDDHRYKNMGRDMDEETLRFACRALALQAHVGMPSADAAVFVYNRVIPHCDRLCNIGDLSSEGEDSRLEQYKHANEDVWQPHSYVDWAEFKNEVDETFDRNTSNNWALIRITKHGTIEFRMGDATEDIEVACHFAQECQTLCLEALDDYNKECRRAAS